MQLEPLCIGIKRATFRANDVDAKQADIIFAPRREAALQKNAYRCVRCGYESTPNPKRRKQSVLHVHHQDDDHHNNEPDNLLTYCSLDHAYQHIGCDAVSPGGSKGWASQMLVAYLPELTPEDVNGLQRAAGAAMTEPSEKEMANEILDLLSVLTLPVKEVVGSFYAKDFAACFSKMTELQYEQRSEHVDGFRVLFHPNILTQVGAEMLDDVALYPVKSWSGVSNGFGIS